MLTFKFFFSGELIAIWSGKTSVMLNGNGCQMLQSWNEKVRERKGVISFFLANLAYTDRKRELLLDRILYLLVLEGGLYACSLLGSSNKQL